MPDQQEPHIYFEPNFHWQNYHQNIAFTPRRYYDLWNLWADGSQPLSDPWRAGLSAICQIVKDAERLNRKVRAIGAGWSLSEAAVTPDFLLNTKPLNFIEIGLHDQNRDPRCPIPGGQLVFAQCGATVLELNVVLERNGLALCTSGASDGQTIAGAISTGTHGAAISFGSMQEAVVGLHIVAEGGLHYWIERQAQPVVSEHFCGVLGATLIRDDDLFDAAVVSFGSFGIIHAVLLRVEPIYLLEKYVWRGEFDKVKPFLPTLDFAGMGLEYPKEIPYHFQVVVDMYASQRGRSGAFLQYMYKRPWRPVPRPGPNRTSVDPGQDIAVSAAIFSDLVPPLVPFLSEIIVAGQIQLEQGQLATPGETFSANEIPTGGLTTEFGVAQEDAPRAIETVIEIAHQYPFPGLASMHYVAPSRALLAFTKFAPTTCAIELPSVDSIRTRRAYELIWTALEKKGIPHTFHWGQCLRPNPLLLRQVFGDRQDRWLAARRKFLKSNGRRTFSNYQLQAWGLADGDST